MQKTLTGDNFNRNVDIIITNNTIQLLMSSLA